MVCCWPAAGYGISSESLFKSLMVTFIHSPSERELIILQTKLINEWGWPILCYSWSGQAPKRGFGSNNDHYPKAQRGLLPLMSSLLELQLPAWVPVEHREHRAAGRKAEAAAEGFCTNSGNSPRVISDSNYPTLLSGDFPQFIHTSVKKMTDMLPACEAFF